MANKKNNNKLCFVSIVEYNLAVNNELIKWLEQPNQWPLHCCITAWEVVGMQSVAKLILRPQLVSNLHEVCKLSAAEFSEDSNLYKLQSLLLAQQELSINQTMAL